jgi:hypothetical protein
MVMLVAGAAATALVAFVGGSIPASIGLLVAAGVALFVIERRSAEVPAVIRAQKIEVVGADGVTRVALGETVEGAGAVATYDSHGRFLAALDIGARKVGVGRPAAGPSDGGRFPTQRSAVARSVAGARASQR